MINIGEMIGKSMGIEVTKSSPAPLSSIFFANSMALIPELFLPPWVKISHLSPFFFASIATTMHCEPNFFELSTTTSEFWTAAVLIDTLSAPQFNNLLMSSTLLTPPPIKNYTDKSEIINEYIPQDEIKNLIQEDLPFIKAENKTENKIKFKLPGISLLKEPSKKERDNSSKNETHDPEFLEKILMDFGVSGNIKKVSHGPAMVAHWRKNISWVSYNVNCS